jgi:MFS family permease
VIKLRLFETYKGLPKSIYVIFFAQIINRFGDFVLPFLTLFLVKKLGLSYESAGFAAMLATLSTIPGSFAGGKIADHFGRKKTYIVFQTAAGVSLFLCIFFSSPNVIIALVCISAFLNGGIRQIISAIITDVLPAEKRQQGFSLSYLGINIGVSLGPLISGFLFNHYIPLIFIGDAVTSFIAVAMVAANIEETLPKHMDNQNIREEEKSETGNVFTVLLKRKKLLVFLIINTFLSVASSQHSFSLPLMLDKVFGADGARNYGFVMSSNAITVVVMTIFVTRVTKRWNPLSSISLSGLLYAVGLGMIAFIHSMPLYILSTYIWTIGEILIVTNFGVYIANNTPQNFRARFNAVTSLSWAIGSVIGTSVMGVYMSSFGVKAVWPLVSCLGIIGAAGMYVLKIKTEKNVNKEAELSSDC